MPISSPIAPAMAGAIHLRRRLRMPLHRLSAACLIALLAGFPASHAYADSALNLEHPATATPHISISNIKGSVTVTAWDRNSVHVSGELGDGAKPLVIEGSDGDMRIEVQAQGKSGFLNWGSDNSMGSSTLQIQVPRGSALEVSVVSASLNVDGLKGGKIDLNAVSGRVRVDAQTPSLSIDSVSGSIEQTGHADKADLQTVSGDIRAPDLGHEATLQTVSGDIKAVGGPWSKLTLSTVSGGAQINGGLAAQGSIHIDSMSGDVQLQLPADLSAQIDASSFSGDLRSDFGTPKESEHGPGSSLQTTAGQGNGKVSISSFSGDVHIRKGT